MGETICMVRGHLWLSPCVDMTVDTLRSGQWARRVSFRALDMVCGLVRPANDNSGRALLVAVPTQSEPEK